MLKGRDNTIKELQKKIGIGVVKNQDILEKQVNQVYLSVGSNLGNKIKNIEMTKFKLQQHNIRILKCSSNYISDSWPNSSLPKYINIILKVTTSLAPLEFLKTCNLIELKLGRVRRKKNEPRTCDIDILDFQHKIIKPSKLFDLTLPHPSISTRNFVLLPLYEISKSWIHPRSKRSVTNLINKLSINDLRAIKQI